MSISGANNRFIMPLIEAGAVVNEPVDCALHPSFLGYNAFLTACQFNNLEATRMLLAHNVVEVNRTNNSGESLLYSLSQRNNAPAVKLLLEHSAKVDMPANDGTTPLQAALSCSFRTGLLNDAAVEVASLLLAHGANPNLTYKDGRMLILDACTKNFPKVVELLLKYNADVRAETLAIPVRLGYEEVVELLLKHHVSPNLAYCDISTYYYCNYKWSYERSNAIT
jgi:hypothetical protein